MAVLTMHHWPDRARGLDELARVAQRRLVIVTHDADFLRIHAAGVPHAGIVYCHKDTLSVGEIIIGLVLIWETYDRQAMASQVEFLKSHLKVA